MLGWPIRGDFWLEMVLTAVSLCWVSLRYLRMCHVVITVWLIDSTETFCLTCICVKDYHSVAHSQHKACFESLCTIFSHVNWLPHCGSSCGVSPQTYPHRVAADMLYVYKPSGTEPLGTVRPSFATLQRTLFMYLINKYISLSDICLTVHHWYK